MRSVKWNLFIFLAVLCWLPVQSAVARPAVQPITAAGLRKEIARHRGKVVLVNFWATWCPGCVQEFPDLVRLQRNYAAKGLDVIFVSGNDFSEKKSLVVPFLGSKGVARTSYILQEGLGVFGSRFDPQSKTAFALPRTYIYNRRGRLVSKLSDTQFYAKLQRIVKQHL